MIRQAEASDECEIRACAEQAYARYVPVIGRKPAPMVADFRARIQVARRTEDGFKRVYFEKSLNSPGAS